MIETAGLTKRYRRGSEEVHALVDVSLRIGRGESAAIVGPSGSGKTTLLNLIGCLDVPTSGSLRIGGHEVGGLPESGLIQLRRERLGFVFQQFRLVPTLTVLENVLLPALFAGRADRGRARELIERVGLEHRLSHRPHELSGGEMQRAAIARALINSPEILLADEPTGNLDTESGERVMELFQEFHAAGLTIVLITHNPGLADRMDRRFELNDGRLTSPKQAL
jgi:putative ABC transport system ATP-binding protein